MPDAFLQFSQALLAWYAINAVLFFLGTLIDKGLLEMVRDEPALQGRQWLFFVLIIHVLVPGLILGGIVIAYRLLRGEKLKDIELDD